MSNYPQDSVTGYGSVTGTNVTAGNVIASIASGSLPAGVYKIEVYAYISAAATPALSDNAELRAGSTVLGRISMLAAVATGAGMAAPRLTMYRRLDGRTGLTVNFNANYGAAETQTWNVQIVATRMGDY